MFRCCPKSWNGAHKSYLKAPWDTDYSKQLDVRRQRTSSERAVRNTKIDARKQVPEGPCAKEAPEGRSRPPGIQLCLLPEPQRGARHELLMEHFPPWICTSLPISGGKVVMGSPPPQQLTCPGAQSRQSRPSTLLPALPHLTAFLRTPAPRNAGRPGRQHSQLGQRLKITCNLSEDRFLKRNKE